MSHKPVFAVVGHPNKGKSSVVATLSQNDAIVIALEPGTTRQHQAYPLSVDGQILYTLVDTPGFQRPRRVLAWLEAHSLSASDRAETVAAFVRQHSGDPRYHDECELLTPVLEGAGIIYVVDGSVPYSPENEAEMTILRWTGQPSLALVNSIGADDHGDTWQAALSQFFQVVKRFNAVTASFQQHLSLLKTFGQLEPDWERPLEQAINHLSNQRHQRRRQAAELTAQAVEDMLLRREKQTLIVADASTASRESLAGQLRQRWHDHQRQREEALRLAIERLYQHNHIHRQGALLTWQNDHDLFSERSRRAFGVSRSYLTTAGFGAGAAGGIGLDALTLGHSLGAGALIGGLVGAAGSYFYGDRLSFSALRLGPLQQGMQTASFGPVQDSQFGYVVLGRAVDHWWRISHRNHAGQDLLQLENTDSHWLTRLDRTSRRDLQRAFEQCRKKGSLDRAMRQRLSLAVEASFQAYDDWQLNPT
ncbi:MAG: GTPase/DUF3482 domain-containing protein [Oleiphilaceae bacterium]|nr:GTPase/DUF3482 domain-containing protein [Oleiphilaceae bacterium]